MQSVLADGIPGAWALVAEEQLTATVDGGRSMAREEVDGRVRDIVIQGGRQGARHACEVVVHDQRAALEGVGVQQVSVGEQVDR